MNYMINGAMEIVAYFVAMFIVERFGRRWVGCQITTIQIQQLHFLGSCKSGRISTAERGNMAGSELR